MRDILNGGTNLPATNAGNATSGEKAWYTRITESSKRALISNIKPFPNFGACASFTLRHAVFKTNRTR
jgi:hypothetical protein